MCGRYSFTKVPEEAQIVFPENSDLWIRPRFNIAPSQLCPIIPHHDPLQTYYYRWGLIPHWAKDIKIGYRMINARSETVLEKPAFKTPFRKSRCLVWADGFYEWKKGPSGKQPYRIMMKDEKAFFFGGITSLWQAPDGKMIHSFSILTTEPNQLMEDIHDRMPVIIPRESMDEWLDTEKPAETLLPLLEPFPAAEMKAYAVNPAVGNVRNDDESLIEPWTGQNTLFD